MQSSEPTPEPRALFAQILGTVGEALYDGVAAANTHAARLDRFCADYGVPEGTLRALMAQDKGPRVFTIGRLQFCRRADWTAWLDTLAESGGTGRLSPSAARLSRESTAA